MIAFVSRLVFQIVKQSMDMVFLDSCPFGNLLYTGKNVPGVAGRGACLELRQAGLYGVLFVPFIDIADCLVNVFNLIVGEAVLATQETLLFKVAGMKKENTLCPFLSLLKLAVASGPACLLIIGLRCCRRIEMDNKSEPPYIYTHPESVRTGNDI